MAEEPVHENDVAGPAHVQVEQHHMEMKQAHTMNEMYINKSFK